MRDPKEKPSGYRALPIKKLKRIWRKNVRRTITNWEKMANGR